MSFNFFADNITQDERKEKILKLQEMCSSVSWGHALSVGIQHTAFIGLAVGIYNIFLPFMQKLFYYFSGSFTDNIFPSKDPY